MAKINKADINNARRELCSTSTNKFWGLICILSAIETTAPIEAGVEYKIHTSSLKQTLRRLFDLKDIGKPINSENDFYIIFSKDWAQVAKDSFAKAKNESGAVSILDTALYYHVNSHFEEEEIAPYELIQKFTQSLHITEEDANKLFSFDNIRENPIHTEDYTNQDLYDFISKSMKWDSDAPPYLGFSDTGLSKCAPDELTRAPFIQPLYASLEGAQCLLLSRNSFSEGYNFDAITTEVKAKQLIPSSRYQTIVYGAPGTGKSYYLKQSTSSTQTIRTTFHPDSDYSSFVGLYKPTCDSEGNVTYKFTPQALARAYVLAWQEYLKVGQLDSIKNVFANKTEFLKSYINWLPDNNVNTEATQSQYKSLASTFIKRIGEDKSNSHILATLNEVIENEPNSDNKSKLKKLRDYLKTLSLHSESTNSQTSDICLIIEEINRGNCAQIFGDIFQLLDRNPYGFSEYPIDVDNDFAQYLESELGDVPQYKEEICKIANCSSEEFSYSKIALPCNLKILATMNTSDQSLFPMDSAFKRRWDWQYIPIDETKVTHIKIDIDTTYYSWSSFLQKVNQQIYNVNTSEDKQLGPFFIKPANGVSTITKEDFISKVMFYLWFEIYKDEDQDSIFKTDLGEDENATLQNESFTFSELFSTSSSDILHGFMKRLGVDIIRP